MTELDIRDIEGESERPVREVESLQMLFLSFLKNFKDSRGRFKYRERVREMIIKEGRSLLIDYEDIINYDPHLADIIENNPDEALMALSESIRELVRDEDPEYVNKVYRFYARLSGWVKATPIRQLRSEHINKLVMVDGIIVRATPPRQKLYKAVYAHILSTGEKHEFEWPPGEVEEIGDELEKPTYCPICVSMAFTDEFEELGGRKRGTKGIFKLIPEKSKYRDWQLIVIQEKPEEIPAGQIPRSIEVVLTDDLVDVARPGDRVSIVGIIRLSRGRRSAKPIFTTYIEANNVIVAQRFLEELKLSIEDEEKIIALSKDPLIRRKIIASIAPTIYGMWDIKEAVALLLFGGIPKVSPDGTKIRGEIHVLLLGDPGTAKSLCYSEPLLLIDKSGEMSFEPIGKIIDDYMRIYSKYVKREGDTEILYLNDIDIELYTVSISPSTLRPEIKRVKALIRHKAPNEVLIVRTKTGRATIITEDHSLVAFDGNTLRPVKPYEALNMKLLIPVLRRLPYNENFTRTQRITIGKVEVNLDEELGYFIGYFLGDGTITKTSSGERLEIVTSDLDIAKELAKTLKDKVRVEVKIYKKRSTHNEYLWRVVTHDKNLIEWVKREFYDNVSHDGRKGVITTHKIMPKFILNSPADTIAGVLSGLIDSDGAAQSPQVKNNGKGWRGEVSITTISKRLAQEISLLLSILGITHIIRHRKLICKDREIRYYTIFISDATVKNIIRLRNRRKAAALAKYREATSDVVDKVVIPVNTLAVMTVLNMNRRKGDYRSLASEIRGNVYRGYAGRRYSERIIGKLSAIAERGDIANKELALSLISQFKDVVDNDSVFWDVIKSIKKVKIADVEPDNHKYVYDISVEDNENFVGGLGSMFLHNSQILQYVARIAPRGIYTTGKGSSAAGLTATVIKDKQTGEYFLEAGAMVLGDGGVVAIDEIDKMREEDRVAIHEAMEQGTVSIAKAGIVARLNARASVLAAGNPKRGRYIPREGVAGNINLPVTILSRFDLIFILKDIAEISRDESLVRYVLRTHERHGHITPEIEPELLRKYIAYARKYVRPTLSEDAEEIIREYYIELRKKSAEKEDAPLAITTRQLEALIRLAEAHARMALKDRVTAEDAAEAVRLMNTMLEKVGMDVETGLLDIDTILVGKPKSMREKEIAVLDLIKDLAEENERLGCAKIKNLKREASELGIDDVSLDRILRNLRRSGDIYEKRPGCYAPVE